MNFSESNLVFLFSLPRSGSTLLQRILAAHSRIVTTSETWILLPLLYPFCDGEVFADYDYETCNRAVRDFVLTTDSATGGYKKAAARLVTDIFGRISKNQPDSLFLEKTPRNNLIVEQLVEVFPTSKFIFMWRNPIAVASSIVETFGKGKWKIKNYEIDLYKGLENMISAYQVCPHNAIAVRYEDLIEDPISVCEHVFDFLGLPLEPQVITKFTETKLYGTVGDKIGVASYKTISGEPLTKWRSTIRNPLRKRWVRRYLDWIGNDRLAVMGYSSAELYSSLDQTPTSLAGFGEDVTRTLYGLTDALLELGILKRKVSSLMRGRKIYVHR